ncbi:MAG: DNA alkylation repair protein [Terrimicrobiaceae bacterium]
MSEPSAPALKEYFNATRFRQIAKDVAAVHPGFDARGFLTLSLPGLDELSLLQRLRRVTVSLHATLPSNYRQTLSVLRKLAPRIDSGFVTLFMPDYVGLYGHDHFDASMEALKFFTPFGSSEFGVRPFLKADLHRTLKVMERWAEDEDEQVRRLASEGCRPRLPWSFRLEALIADPAPTARILENLKADPSLYVRKSVANHLNDITKDHPARVLERIAGWDMENARCAWIAKRALRSLIKAGDRRALSLLGAGQAAAVRMEEFTIAPKHVHLGEAIRIGIRLASLGRKPQKLIVDYKVHYVKKSGSASAKVFKWKELRMEPGQVIELAKRQTIRDFSTRKHHAGEHRVEVMINGAVFGEGSFQLSL